MSLRWTPDFGRPDKVELPGWEAPYQEQDDGWEATSVWGPIPGSGVDLISRALGIGAEVVRDALHLHRTGQQPPGRIDGRRRQRRQPSKPFVPKYQQIAPEVDRRRKAGEGFDRLAREMKVSRPMVVRAYDFANRDEAAAAAREGRAPTRPPYRWSEESRAAKRKPRDA
jgi:hypothetical protein